VEENPVMKKLSTPTLCFLMGLLAVLAVFSPISQAAADPSWKHPPSRHHNLHKQDHRRSHHFQGHRYRQHPRTSVVIYREIYYAPSIRPVEDIVWQNPVWQNPDSTSQAYEATDWGAETAANHCREYTATATVAGQTQQIYGQACLQPDGSWKPVR
jgi:hypothetical protein